MNDENQHHTIKPLGADSKQSFIESILLDRNPIVDIGDSLNMTLAGIIAHQSALKGGERMKIPQYDL